MFHVSGLLAATFTTNEAKAPCAPMLLLQQQQQGN